MSLNADLAVRLRHSLRGRNALGSPTAQSAKFQGPLRSSLPSIFRGVVRGTSDGAPAHAIRWNRLSAQDAEHVHGFDFPGFGSGPSPTLRQYRMVPSDTESISEPDLVVTNFICDQRCPRPFDSVSRSPVLRVEERHPPANSFTATGGFVYVEAGLDRRLQNYTRRQYLCGFDALSHEMG